jgi:DNA repair ATPase RecN
MLEAENKRLQGANEANARVAELENRLDDSERLNAQLQQELVAISRRLAEAEAARSATTKNDVDNSKAQAAKVEELTKRVRQLEGENKQYLADIDGLVRQTTALKVRIDALISCTLTRCACSKWRLRRGRTKSSES